MMGMLAPIQAKELKAVAVARVALAVGEASRVSATQTEPLRVGSTVYAGDRIRTGPDAVAMLVFIDEGRISVRPESELWIKQYLIDPKGVDTRIELELTKGTVRQISGNASRLQPERYRLNTPVAAIGVRGTDFLAKTSAEGVQTLVQEGKIFVQANRLEPCAQIDCGALLGPGQSAGSYLKLSSGGDIEQRAYRAGDIEQHFALNLIMQAPSKRQALAQATELARLKSAESELPAGAQFISDTIFAVTQNRNLAFSPSAPPLDPSPPTTGPSEGSSTGVVADPTLPADLATNTAALLQRQLVWGRFSQASELPNQWVVSYAQAAQGRHVSVGELGQYALWRVGAAGGSIDASLQGLARFNLLGAQAVLEQASGGISSALVRAATLEINFDRASFLAGVDLVHQATGAQSLLVSGIVNNEGVFLGVNESERVAGAISRDGTEAGYLFSKDTSAGRLRGITLWTRSK